MLWKATPELSLCVTAALWTSTSLPEYAKLPPAVDVSLYLANRARGAPQGDTEVRANGPLLGRNWLGTEATQKPCSEITLITFQAKFSFFWEDCNILSRKH